MMPPTLCGVMLKLWGRIITGPGPRKMLSRGLLDGMVCMRGILGEPGLGWGSMLVLGVSAGRNTVGLGGLDCLTNTGPRALGKLEAGGGGPLVKTVAGGGGPLVNVLS